VTANLIQNFEQCIFERDKSGHLQGVEYSSEWKQIKREQRRGPFDRRMTPEWRRLQESDASIPGEGKEERRKNLTARRDIRRITCGDCRKDFQDVASIMAHQPCKASHELVRLGFWDFIAGIAQNGGPSTGETEKLRNVVLTSLSEDAYRLACSGHLFVPQRLVAEEKKLRAYQLAWLAALLSLIRPDEINLDLLTRTDREQISRIAETFIRVPDGPQRKIVRQFFASPIRLEEIGKTGRVPDKPISEKTRSAFLGTVGTIGKRLASALSILGADYWSPLSALEAYQKDSSGFSRDLYKLGRRIGRKTRTPRKSPPTRR
jgi:hypothetical protein